MIMAADQDGWATWSVDILQQMIILTIFLFKNLFLQVALTITKNDPVDVPGSRLQNLLLGTQVVVDTDAWGVVCCFCLTH